MISTSPRISRKAFLMSTPALARNSHLAMFGLCLVLATSTFIINLEITHSVTKLIQTSTMREAVISPRRGLSVHQSPPVVRRKNTQLTKNGSKNGVSLDFFIAGFPKCGTTTLLYAFGKHSETSISNVEKCSFGDPKIPDTAAKQKLNQALAELDPSPSTKRGIKCPSGIKSFRAIERLESHSSESRILIGMRHPVKFFQSYYNYRVTELYDRNLREKVPEIESLVGSNEWKGVSTDGARFELFLMQLGKTNLTLNDIGQLASRPNTAIRPTPFKVFLYSLEQLEDTNEKRAEVFRKDMQDFLQLKEPLPPFGHENLNHFTGAKAHPESIDICDEKYSDLRTKLIVQGAGTQKWIRSELLESVDVTAGGRNYFLKLIERWGSDPC